MASLLTHEHVEDFCQNGYVVIEDVLSEEEVQKARNAFHADLKMLGIDHEQILRGQTKPPQECAIKSPVADLFYMRWKLLDIHLNPKIVCTMHDLLKATFLNVENHAFDRPCSVLSDRMFAYIDRVCYRLPNQIRNEKGLGLHLDRHPTMPYAAMKKWRPIQAFVTLTDHWGGATGGLQVVPGFHLRNDFFNHGSEIKESAGEFYRMGDHAYDSLRKSLVTVQAPKGALVCWDNRLPHATCQNLEGNDSREVVFVGFLPDIKLNWDYVIRQRECLLKSLSPPAYDSLPVSGPDFSPNDMSFQQRQLLGF